MLFKYCAENLIVSRLISAKDEYMKIGFTSDAVYPWNIGGLEALESTEAKELAKNHEVHFFSLKWPGMEKDFIKDNIHYHTLHDITVENFYRHGRRSIREALAYTIGLVRIFFYKFDYIQSNEFPILQIPILKFYCMLTGCKLILDIHEVWDRKYWMSYLGGGVRGHLANAFSSYVLRMADAYIANSSVTAQKLEGLGIKKDKIGLFSPVINDKVLNSIKAGKVQKSAIFSGRLIKEKRVDKWLKVLKSAAKNAKGAKGIIVGEGPERRSLESMIRSMKMSNTVSLRGFYPEEEKAKLYRSIKESKALLQMSEREGLSIIVLESLFLGTPVLLPDYSPIPDEVKRMCIVRDEVSMSDTLADMLNSPDKSKYIKNKEGLENFSVSSTNKFYGNLFRKLGE